MLISLKFELFSLGFLYKSYLRIYATETTEESVE